MSLLMHVFGEAVVWVSDFRLQRLCALWRHGAVIDGNLITAPAMCTVLPAKRDRDGALIEIITLSNSFSRIVVLNYL